MVQVTEHQWDDKDVCRRCGTHATSGGAAACPGEDVRRLPMKPLTPTARLLLIALIGMAGLDKGPMS